jgi:uncharacterized protein YhaN
MLPSNNQKAQEFYETCKKLIKQRLAAGTLAFSAEGKVIRSEIYQAINASRAVMSQNRRIRRLLGATERWARINGVMPLEQPEKSNGFGRVSGNSDPVITQMQARISHLEKLVAALSVENRELKQAVKRSDWLDKFLGDSTSRLGALPW